MKHTKQALFHSIVALILCCSMLVGTTFAWFTDEVTSGVNKIQAGNLDIELEYLDGGDWKPVKSDKSVFPEGILWEPGHTEVVYLRIVNKGNLALKYQLGIGVEGETLSVTESGEVIQLSKYIHFGAVDGVSVPFANRDAARAAVTESKALTAGYTKTGTMTATNETAYMALVVYMPESVGNEANHATGADAPSINMGIRLLATQMNSEMDSFGSDYDVNAQWPVQNGIWTTSAPVSVSNGTVSTETTVGGANDLFTAKVPAGVKVNDGTEAMSLTVSTKTGNKADVKLEAGQVGLSLDVHMDGVAEDNTVPMTINLGKIAPTGLYDGNIKLYHVEGDQTITMTKVATLAELDAHNEFYYDAQTGEVFLSMASFSEVYAAVAFDNPWNGTVDKELAGAGTAETPYIISSAAELAGFAQLVAEGNTFAGKVVKLAANINMGGASVTDANGKLCFYPIGVSVSGNSDTISAFSGTFDGDGHTISNIYQNTWMLKGHYDNGYYNEAMGLFGLIDGGTVKDLVISDMVCEGEFADMGCVTAYARGNCTFEDIRIAEVSMYCYNCRTAGIVGYDWIGNTGSNLTFKDIEIHPSCTFGALWGSWDVACAGILGYKNDASKVTFTNCEVGCELDVFNDVCANYQYYDYRYAGMMIGTVGKDGDPSDQLNNGNIKFDGCKVYYGDWVDHYHCELVVNSPASYTHDYQMSRLVKISSLSEIKDSKGWIKAGNFLLIEGNTKTCYHIVNKDGTLTEHKHEDSGKQTIDGQEVLVEDKQIVHTVFNQIFTGYGWGATAQAPGVDGITNVLYTITYIHNGMEVDVVYVTQADVNAAGANGVNTTNNVVCQYITDALGKDDKGNSYVFDHWMNAGSVQVDNVTTTNKDIVLYPSFKSHYTVTYVDSNGTVLYFETIVAGTAKPSKVPAVPAIAGGYTGVWSMTDFSKINGDVTVYPIYNANDGIVKLEPVDNEPKDGVVDHYIVTSVEESDANINIVIPASFNGKPVIEIAGGAFAEFDNITTVKIPVSITTIGADAFANEERNWGTLKYEQITFLYEGSYEKWQAIQKDPNWDRYVGQGSKIYFLADGTYIEETKRNGTGILGDVPAREWSDPKTGTYTG